MSKIRIKWILVDGFKNPFYISATPITSAQFNIYGAAIGYSGNQTILNTGHGDHPVVGVNYAGAVAFCKWLSKETGSTIRLPKTDQWIFAARGGNKSQNYDYSGSDDLAEVGWYDKNSGSQIHAVALKKPNELGIYDMSGNVFEMCRPRVGNICSARGGSWSSINYICWVCFNSFHNANEGDDNVGFRIVRE